MYFQVRARSPHPKTTEIEDNVIYKNGSMKNGNGALKENGNGALALKENGAVKNGYTNGHVSAPPVRARTVLPAGN